VELTDQTLAFFWGDKRNFDFPTQVYC
jgi:hypothetical protein